MSLFAYTVSDFENNATFHTPNIPCSAGDLKCYPASLSLHGKTLYIQPHIKSYSTGGSPFYGSYYYNLLFIDTSGPSRTSAGLMITQGGDTGLKVYYSVNYLISPTCPTGQHLDYSLKKCVINSCPGAHISYDTTLQKCVCKKGYAMDSNGTCGCYVGNAQYTYAANKTQCNNLNVVKITDLQALYQFAWNSCLKDCTAQSVPLCQKGYIYNNYGQCVPAILDNSQCSANGGTLKNARITENSTCIQIDKSRNPSIISPCCQKVADCVNAKGKMIGNSSMYVQCGVTLDINTTTPTQKCTTCSGKTPIPTKNGYCTNSSQSAYNDCPNPANMCKNCPTDYPIPNNSGNCLNSSGAFTTCPSSPDTNYTKPSSQTPICQTCGLLQGGWSSANNGQCKRLTPSGVVQYASCPATPESNNTTPVNPNPRPSSNSSFTDVNNSNSPTIGHNSGTQTDTNGSKVVNVCKSCRAGYKNLNGICVLVSTNGTIVSTTPCPTPIQQQKSNSKGALDKNGSDKNLTGIANQLGEYGANEIKKAYKSYNIFPTSKCGTLQALNDVKMFGGRLTIKDPLPAFRDVLEPFRNMISNVLLFIVSIIGLFDFFRRD